MSRRRSPFRPLRWLLRLLLVLLAVLLLPVLALKWLPPPTTAFMLQSEVRPVQYQWVPMERIAKVAGQAVIAAEDQKFPLHSGFDLEAIKKAQAHNRKSRRIRGASTISQQTAKNLFLWPGGGYFRKGIEAVYTLLLETLWGKERILEVYLNVAEFGPGIYGVEAASQRYFGKPAAKLSAAEAARLAAVLPSPRRWSVSKPGPYVQKRAAWVLRQMGYGQRARLAAEPEPEPPADSDPDSDPDPASEAAARPPTVPEQQSQAPEGAESTVPAAEGAAPQPVPVPTEP
ncbi:monofunctional biosynthetic peptidoglycan transglycosylase [Stagnimonas aquatica]|uniref:Biosynthetic peptidoglycan transglycosylase n=1 Tax=Stagnimonas aquatica TaxID=2689987 RepID=A0A3N0VDU1_9GAMM|nr:monofunctional biosynthetic peptidoglycan transglycosylase [Stagnimonas aquatica]ROH90947.1 monofunctional biosynthetic peptidoglycan transglycosylase [Stagnimonas aquatica]